MADCDKLSAAVKLMSVMRLSGSKVADGRGLSPARTSVCAAMLYDGSFCVAAEAGATFAQRPPRATKQTTARVLARETRRNSMALDLFIGSRD